MPKADAVVKIMADKCGAVFCFTVTASDGRRQGRIEDIVFKAIKAVSGGIRDMYWVDCNLGVVFLREAQDAQSLAGRVATAAHESGVSVTVEVA